MTKVEAEEEIKVKVKVKVVVVMMDNRVEETMRRNDALSIKENIYGENAHPIGEAMLIKKSMDVANDEAEGPTIVVINHITRNSMSIYLLLLLQDKELYHLLRWLQ